MIYSDFNSIESYLPESLRQILVECESNIFLIGGAIRDKFLARKTHDYDFVIDGNVRLCANHVAKRLEGHLYVLDNQRKTFRVIYYSDKGERKTLDFASIRGDDIYYDLKTRDFTVNAIAVNIRDTKIILDPLNGVKDIQKKIVRACYKGAFVDDPIRILRGIRIAHTLSFRIIGETWQLMKDAVEYIPNLSVERIRDEIFLMFDHELAYAMMRTLQYIGLSDIFYKYPLTGCDKQNVNIKEDDLLIQAIRRYLEIYNVLIGQNDQGFGNNLLLGIALSELGKYKENLRQHYQNALCIERSLKSLSVFSIIYSLLYIDIEICNYLSYFKLSNKEIKWIEAIVRHHQIMMNWFENNQTPEDIDIYRYFKNSGAAGIDACIISLAFYLAHHNFDVDQSVWERVLKNCGLIFEAWFNKKEKIVEPPRLITGYDIQKLFNLKTNIIIGGVLSKVKEAQVLGEIRSKEDALEFARSIVEKM